MAVTVGQDEGRAVVTAPDGTIIYQDISKDAGLAFRKAPNTIYVKFHKETWFSPIWSYLCERYPPIEDRMLEAKRYLEFDSLNARSFSFEFSSILRDTGSVLSSVLDGFYRGTNPEFKGETNMGHYKKWLRENIAETYYAFLSVGLNVSSLDRFVRPFSDLIERKDEEPETWKTKKIKWWNAYNNVKHSDIENRRDGNFQNTISSVGALAILLSLSSKQGLTSTALFGDIGMVSPENNLTPHLMFKDELSTER